MTEVGVSSWLLKVVYLLTGSLAYWYLVCLMTDQNEPWDAASYWVIWYPLSLGLSALGGYALKSRSWSAGVIVTFAQLPVMVMINGEVGALIAVGLVLLVGLAMPAAAIAKAAGRLGTRR